VKRALSAPYFFKKDDRVVRRLYDSANKLQYLYAGPYRVEAVLGDGRYRLTDLENNHVNKDIDVSNLRPYRTHVDAEALRADEYLVDCLINHRRAGDQREYLVKWRGYPRSQATWEPRKGLEPRCMELIVQYEADLQDKAKRGRLRHPRVPKAAELPATAPSAAPPLVGEAPAADPATGNPPPPAAATNDHRPTVARFERGQWMYGRTERTARGERVRMKPSSHFTATELASEYFENLRQAASDAVVDPVAAAALGELRQLARSVRVWFYSPPSSHRREALVLCFRRKDDGHFDTFGGDMEPKDQGEFNRTALRELRERTKLPKLWVEDCHTELASFPDGRRMAVHSSSSREGPSKVAVWGVPIPSEIKHLPIQPTEYGSTELRAGTLRWRPLARVIAELHQDDALRSMGDALAAVTSDELES
jgi:hypothetical protein